MGIIRYEDTMAMTKWDWIKFLFRHPFLFVRLNLRKHRFTSLDCSEYLTELCNSSGKMHNYGQF